MTKIFDGLPTDLSEAREQGMIPWTDVVREDFHVTVFRTTDSEGETLIFVPEYATLGVIEDCLGDALRSGSQMVEGGQWENYFINIVICSKGEGWPHVVLSSGDQKC